MFENLSLESAFDVLEKNIYGHLGCHASGKTYIVPISYAFDGEFIYCHTADGLKMEMMRSNPAVCFQVQEIDSLANWKSIIINGKFRELKGGQRKKGIAALLGRNVPAIVTETVKIAPDWPFADPEHIEIPGIIFSISIDEISGKSGNTPAQEK